MMHEANRQPAEQRAPQRIEKPNDPFVVLVAVDPDQHVASGLRGPRHLRQGALGRLQVMNDPDREHDIIGAVLIDFVGAFFLHRHCGKRGEIAPRHRQRRVIDIDRLAPRRAVGHRPMAVASHAATDIEKIAPLPVFGRERQRPGAELRLVFRSQLRVLGPLIAEALR